MIVNAVSTNRISPAVAFKGAPEEKRIWSIFIKKQDDVLALGGIQEGTTIGAKSACTNDEALDVILRFAKEHNLGETKEVIKEVPVSTATVGQTAQNALNSSTSALKKYGIPAAIALVAAVAAFFIGKSAEKSRVAKLEGEDSVVTQNKQPQPVLQEAAKPETSLEDFFSPTKEAPKEAVK